MSGYTWLWILSFGVLSLLASIVSCLPLDINRLDIVLDGKDQIYEKVLFGEPVIFTGDEELLQYEQHKNKKSSAKKSKHADKENNHKHGEHGDNSIKDIKGKHHKQQTCSPVTLHVCRDLDLYPLAQFPNILGHESVKEAKSALSPYMGLMKDPTCGLVLKKFTCLLLSPQCTGTDEPLSPCRSVCRAAKEGCARAMKQAGHTWPKEWACNGLPDDSLCADLDINITPFPEPINKLKGRHHSMKITDHVKRQNSSSQSAASAHHTQPISDQLRHRSITKPRRYDIGQVGQPGLFQGWADVQGQGAANDYCRVIGTNPRLQFLSCTLAGSIQPDHHYVSKRGFDGGHPDTWFMRDMDGDGRDDYCRCVGRGIKSVVSCMKAGERGFYGSPQQPGDEYTFIVPSPGPCFQRKVNPFIGI